MELGILSSVGSNSSRRVELFGLTNCARFSRDTTMVSRTCNRDRDRIRLMEGAANSVGICNLIGAGFYFILRTKQASVCKLLFLLLRHPLCRFGILYTRLQS